MSRDEPPATSEDWAYFWRWVDYLLTQWRRGDNDEDLLEGVKASRSTCVAVAWTMTHRSGAGRECYQSADTIAWKLGLGPDHVGRIRRMLIEDGLYQSFSPKRWHKTHSGQWVEKHHVAIPGEATVAPLKLTPAKQPAREPARPQAGPGGHVAITALQSWDECPVCAEALTFADHPADLYVP